METVTSETGIDGYGHVSPVELLVYYGLIYHDEAIEYGKRWRNVA